MLILSTRTFGDWGVSQSKRKRQALERLSLDWKIPPAKGDSIKPVATVLQLLSQ